MHTTDPCPACGAPSPIDRSEGARCSSCGNALTASPLVDELDAHRARAESVGGETFRERSEGHSLNLHGGRLGTVLFVCLSAVVAASTLFFAWLLHVPLDRTERWSPGGIALAIIVGTLTGVGFAAIDRIVRRRAERAAARDERVLGSPGGDARCSHCGAAVEGRVGLAVTCAHCASSVFGDAPGLDAAADRIQRRAEHWREAQERSLRRRMIQSQARKNTAAIVICGCFFGAVLVATIACVWSYRVHP